MYDDIRLISAVHGRFGVRFLVRLYVVRGLLEDSLRIRHWQCERVCYEGGTCIKTTESHIYRPNS